MRDLSKRERAKVLLGTCPFCDSKEWQGGPRAGECVNIFCKRCEAGFNVGPGGFAEFIREPNVNALIARLEAQIWVYQWQAWVMSFVTVAVLVLLAVFVFLHH